MTPASTPERPIELLLLSSDAALVSALEDTVPQLPGNVSMTVYADAEVLLDALPADEDTQRFRTVPVILLDAGDAPEQTTTVLATLKQAPRLRRIPTIAIAGDPSASVADELYDAYVNAVIQRPPDEELTERLVEVLQFWLTIPALP